MRAQKGGGRVGPAGPAGPAGPGRAGRAGPAGRASRARMGPQGEIGPPTWNAIFGHFNAKAKGNGAMSLSKHISVIVEIPLVNDIRMAVNRTDNRITGTV